MKKVNLDYKFPYGKYKGKTVKDIIAEDHRYTYWFIYDVLSAEPSKEVDDYDYELRRGITGFGFGNGSGGDMMSGSNYEGWEY